MFSINNNQNIHSFFTNNLFYSTYFILLCFFCFKNTVYADDIQISFPDGKLISESAGNLSITLTLVRDSGSQNVISINYSTDFTVGEDTPATPGADFIATNSVLNWAADESGSKTIGIVVKNDLEKESNEVFDLVILSSDTNVTLNGFSGVLRESIVISDDDVVITQPANDTATNSIASVLNVFCPQLEINQAQQGLVDLCDAFNSATPQQASQALQALSPEASISQTNISYQALSQQLGNISKRLGVLRSGSKVSATNGFALRLKGNNIPVNSLFNNSDKENDNTLGGLLGKRYDVFASGTLSYGEREDTNKESGYTPHSYNLTAGADYRLSPKLILGGAIGGVSTDAPLSNSGGEIKSNGFNLLFYSLYFHNENIYLNSVLSIGQTQMTLTRNIAFSLAGQTVSSSARGKSKSHNSGISIDGGYNWPFQDGFNLDANLQFSYLRNTNTAYEETGSSPYNVAMNEQSSSTLSSAINLQLSKAISTRYGVLVPAVFLQWLVEIGNKAETVSGYFIDDPTKTEFSFNSDDPDTNYYNIGASVSGVLTGGVSIFTSFQTVLAQENYKNYALSVGFRMESPF